MFGKMPIQSKGLLFPGMPIRDKSNGMFPGVSRMRKISEQAAAARFTYLDGWNPDNIYEISIDRSLIDADLTHFPVPIVLNSGQADIWDALQSSAEFTSNDTDYTKSNNDYTVEKTGNSVSWDNVRNDFALTSGKYYWEIEIDTAVASNYQFIGIVESATTGYPGSTVNTYGYIGNSGNKYNNALNMAYGATFTTGDIIGVALDLDNGKIWFSKNGAWQNSGDPVAGTGEAYSGISGTFYAAIGFYYTTGIATILGQNDQVYTTPTGFESFASGFEKIAVTKADGTQLYVEVEQWFMGVEKAIPDVEHNIGGNDEGVDGFSVYGSPVDNDTYYTFDGSTTGLYKADDLGNSATEVCFARVRIHDKDKGVAQVIWKDGGYNNGVAIGIDASGNLGVFGRSSGSSTSIVIPSTDYENNVWYDTYFTRTGVFVLDSVTLTLIAQTTGTCLATDGSNVESIGYSADGSPITGSSGTNNEFFDGDIDTVEIFTEGDLEYIPPRVLLHASRDDFVISSSKDTKLYLYYDNTHADNTEYVGEATPKFTGLSLEPDTSPYTATTLIEDLGITDGDLWAGQTGSNAFLENYAYGIDLHSRQAVDYIMIYCTHASSGSLTAYYGTSYDSMEVLKSEDNITWESVQVFDAPPITVSEAYHCGIKLEFSEAHTSRYFKVVSLDNNIAFTGGVTGQVHEIEAYNNIGLFSSQNVWASDAKVVFNNAQDPSGGANSILDSSDNANNGTAYGAMTSDDLIDGSIGKALDLDGNGDYISIPDTDDFYVGAGNATLLITFKRLRVSTREFMCGQLNSAGSTATGNFAIELQADNTIRIFQGYNVSASFLFSPNLSISDTDLHQIILVRDGNTFICYLDSVAGSVTHDVTSYDFTNQTDIFAIGRAGNYASFYFQSNVEQFLFLKGTALSEAQIKAFYNARINNLLTITEKT